MTCRTVVLVSGSGTNLQTFIDRYPPGTGTAVELAGVFSNRPQAGGLERARRAGIETAVLDHTGFADRAAFDRAMLDVL
ncbi:MAG: phosphoribosylglycinamide formyltransferase, partial [Natronospirillum sp.]|uniref:formyltransferase family protein n=1 Tax=Natronospirillum sp. TaxID=2812955 RepID=UPI0025DF64F9